MLGEFFSSPTSVASIDHLDKPSSDENDWETVTVPDTQETTSTRKGKMLVLLVITLLLVMTAVTLAVHLLAHGTSNLTNQLIRVVVFLTLSVLLYRGHVWASMTLAFATAYGGIRGLALIPQTLENGSAVSMALVASMAIAYIVCALLLFFSPAVRAFLEYQQPTTQGE